MAKRTNFVFSRGKLTVVLDGGAGSSGKGKLGAFLCENADNWKFACCTFMPQAGHWVVLDDGRKFFYQTFNSCAYLHEKYEKIYIGPGGTIELSAFWREIEESKIPHEKIGISPLTSVLQDADTGYERGTHDFNGNELTVVTNSLDRAVTSHRLVMHSPLTVNVYGNIINIEGGLGYRPHIPGSEVVKLLIDNSWACSIRFVNGKVLVEPSNDAGQAVTKDINVSGRCTKDGKILIEITGWKLEKPPIAVVDYEYDITTNESKNGQVAGGPLAATGSTAHGCGANRARRVLRRKEAKYARDIPELQKFICDVPGEIMKRLDKGQSGLLEIAQGFQLSYMLPEFFPFTTSRNVTVAAAIDDMMIPPKYAGNVIINFRTYPIRISSNKYVDKATGKHLTMKEVVDTLAADSADAQKYLADEGLFGQAEMLKSATREMLNARGIDLVEGNSGPGYDDQMELSWKDITESSGSPEPIMEMTSVTKLPRRVFSFSKKNVEQAIKHNDTGHNIYLSLNFADYVDHNLLKLGGTMKMDVKKLTKLKKWVDSNFGKFRSALKFIGTSANMGGQIIVKND